MLRHLALLLFTVVVAGGPARLSAQGKPPLAGADLDAIATLLALEDARQYDEPRLRDLIASSHPEVRRRAVQAVGRIADVRGRALLMPARTDADVEVVATAAFSAGQLKDPEAVVWLGSLLDSPATPSAVAREAASALGKIRSAEARTALARYLSGAALSAPPVVVGEALLAIGRFATREDLAPIVRWTTSSDPELRWRAAWALFRPRDPAAVPHLMRLGTDSSPEVRFWAVRGLAVPAPPAAGQRGAAAAAPTVTPAATPATTPAATPTATATPTPPPFDRARASALLREAVRDSDRRVRTEALRALATHDDDASFAVVLAALDSPDTWLSVSAAEAMGRFASRKDAVIAKLTAAVGADRPTALRVTALTALVPLAPEAALEAATALIKDASVVARGAAVQQFGRLGEPGRERLDALRADPATGALMPPSGGRGGRPTPALKTNADYRRIVDRWIATDYQGAPRPRVILTTVRGEIEVELFAGDAPLGLQHLIRVVESGEIVGTEFGRVVPNFVAQQRAIRDDVVLRDEVNRHGLNRGTLSWASAGLDTGRPGYTLGNTPQPHNEGDFTALGRVVAGMNVVDRIELGDKITAARMK